MQSMFAVVIGLTLLLTAAASASPLKVELTPGPGNPGAPRMGDHLAFHSVITNTGQQPVDGVMAWISLLKVDPGREQPVDLEDWSAQKAVTRAALPPGGTIEVDWPMRLIEDGQYRLLVSAASRGGELATSRLADFYVRRKPVVESSRVLPIALGIPLLLAALLLQRSGILPAIASIRRGWRSTRP